METIQIVLGKELLDAADAAARRSRQNRSQLVREALRQHLRRLDLQAREKSDQDGYLIQPEVRDEQQLWEAEAAWPAE
jgi:metal-responsive CopG/Arc/MetJ family transcriptional regulator